MSLQLRKAGVGSDQFWERALQKYSAANYNPVGHIVLQTCKAFFNFTLMWRYVIAVL